MDCAEADFQVYLDNMASSEIQPSLKRKQQRVATLRLGETVILLFVFHTERMVIWAVAVGLAAIQECGASEVSGTRRVVRLQAKIIKACKQAVKNRPSFSVVAAWRE